MSSTYNSFPDDLYLDDQEALEGSGRGGAIDNRDDLEASGSGLGPDDEDGDDDHGNDIYREDCERISRQWRRNVIYASQRISGAGFQSRQLE